MNCCVSFATALFSSTPRVLAHAGHGRDITGNGAVHYLTEPSHAVLAVTACVIVAVATAVGVRVLRKSRRDEIA